MNTANELLFVFYSFTVHPKNYKAQEVQYLVLENVPGAILSHSHGMEVCFNLPLEQSSRFSGRPAVSTPRVLCPVSTVYLQFVMRICMLHGEILFSTLVVLLYTVVVSFDIFDI